MEQLNILHIGIGNVGKNVLNLIADNQRAIRENLSIDLKYCGFFNSKEGYYYVLGFPLEKTRDYRNIHFSATAREAIEKIPLPFVIIDTTASHDTVPLLLRAVERGGFVVMSNKKPLSGPQEHYNRLHSVHRRRVLYETTVGAGLPIIQTLRNILWTGDTLIQIQGCLSGTLGFICSAIEEGASYSEAVEKAQSMGYTEPDPHEDLSGMDVARKALILCRVMGKTMELNDIKRNPFHTDVPADIPAAQFMQKIKDSNEHYNRLFAHAKKNGNTLRYMATIDNSGVSVGLTEVPKHSPFGQLTGADNLVQFRTKWYDQNPMVIRGPGGGVEVTAAGVLADMLSICF